MADAALFIGNAANTAHVIDLERGLNVPSPAVLGNQASFLLAATNRALTSLMALQQHAEATNPKAVDEIRKTVGHLVAAQAQASQVADAANSGVLGPAFETTTRATLTHLNAAERSMSGIGRAYGAQTFAAAGACPTRAFGAGLGRAKQQPKAPDQGQQKPADQEQPKAPDQVQPKAPDQVQPKAPDQVP